MEQTSSKSAPKQQKRQYHYSSKERAKQAARRAAKTAKKEAEQEQKKLLAAQRKVLRKKEAAKKKAEEAERLSQTIAGESNNQVVTGEQVKEAPRAIQNIIEEEETTVLFKPHPGPQTEFLAAPEKEVLYGGAAGGGKSYAMLMDPLRQMHNKNAKGLLIRKTMPELLELIDHSRVIYPQAFPGAKYNGEEKRWRFPSGASMKFSFVDADADVYRFKGDAYTWIGIDEITHYATPFVWDYLRSRLRTTDPTLQTYMRCTTNPEGIGLWWVKKMFIDPAPWGEPFWARDIETGEILRNPDIPELPEEIRGKPVFKRRFIPAKLKDNPSLLHSPDYMTMLASLPESQRQRLLEGKWDVIEGAAFPEFNTAIHTIEPFDPPHGWFRSRACDFGYVNFTGVLWYAIDHDGVMYIYRELYQKGLNADQLAEKILEIEENEPKELVGILDTECWAQRGHSSLTIADTMIRDYGVKWNKAEKSKGSRVNGKLEIHRRLAVDPILEKPKLVVSKSCPNLIRTLPILPLDKNNPEDVDTDFTEDHLYDALRYAITDRRISRNHNPHQEDYLRKVSRHRVADPMFGY